MRSFSSRTARLALRIGVHLLGTAPLLLLLWGYERSSLGPDPIGEMIRRTGRYALWFFLLSLLPTAIRKISGYGGLVRVRRALGLYAFAYAALHLLAYVGLDYGFDLALLQRSLGEERFILLGLGAFVILLALAITSTDGWIKRLGKNWQQLHRLSYLAGALVIIHYLWSFKEFRREPLMYGGALAALLLVRLPPLEALWQRLRQAVVSWSGS